MNNYYYIYNLTIFNIFEFLLYTFTLVFICFVGIFVLRRDLITVLISVELFLLSSVLNFVMFGIFLGSIVGEIFVIFILVLAAAETAVALAILVSYY